MSKRNCPSVSDLKNYARGEISSQEAIAFDAHFKACRHCESELSRLQNDIVDSLRVAGKTIDSKFDRLIEKIRSQLLRSGRYDTCQIAVAGGQAVLFQGKAGNRELAIKVLDRNYTSLKSCGQSDWRHQVDRLTREFEFGSEFEHENLVHAKSLLAATNEGIRPVTVMELACSGPNDLPQQVIVEFDFLPGRNLRRLLDEIRPNDDGFGLADVRKLLIEMARAMKVYSRVMIHRDISPNNILAVDTPTRARRFVLIDYALAKEWVEPPKTDPFRGTMPGTSLGTRGFMSPEQATDATSVDIRSDIFSLGRVALWVLSDPETRVSLWRSDGGWSQTIDRLPGNYRQLLAAMTSNDRDFRPRSPDRLLELAIKLNPLPKEFKNRRFRRAFGSPEVLRIVVLVIALACVVLTAAAFAYQTAKHDRPRHVRPPHVNFVPDRSSPRDN